MCLANKGIIPETGISENYIFSLVVSCILEQKWFVEFMKSRLRGSLTISY
jgi:hypothetical protein